MSPATRKAARRWLEQHAQRAAQDAGEAIPARLVDSLAELLDGQTTDLVDAAEKVLAATPNVSGDHALDSALHELVTAVAAAKGSP